MCFVTENSSSSCPCKERQWHDQAKWCVSHQHSSQLTVHSSLGRTRLALPKSPALIACGDDTGSPLDLIASETLRWKVQEPVLLLGKQRFAGVDIRIRAKGGGHVSQIYGMLQSQQPSQHCVPGCSQETTSWNMPFNSLFVTQQSDKPSLRALWRSTRNVSFPALVGDALQWLVLCGAIFARELSLHGALGVRSHLCSDTVGCCSC